jgi:hypothetical protein
MSIDIEEVDLSADVPLDAFLRGYLASPKRGSTRRARLIHLGPSLRLAARRNWS